MLDKVLIVARTEEHKVLASFSFIVQDVVLYRSMDDVHLEVNLQRVNLNLVNCVKLKDKFIGCTELAKK